LSYINRLCQWEIRDLFSRAPTFDAEHFVPLRAGGGLMKRDLSVKVVAPIAASAAL
jgi:hypothetical protein